METSNFFFLVVLIFGLFMMGLVFLGSDEGNFREVSATLHQEVKNIGVN